MIMLLKGLTEPQKRTSESRNEKKGLGSVGIVPEKVCDLAIFNRIPLMNNEHDLFRCSRS